MAKNDRISSMHFQRPWEPTAILSEVVADKLLLETGDKLLLESGDFLLLE